MVITKASHTATIYNYSSQESDTEVEWVPCHVIRKYPFGMRGSISVNNLVSPDFTRMIDNNFNENVIQIRDIATFKIVRTIPQGMIRLCSRDKK